MAQPGNFTPILLYGSSTPTNVPLAANLTNSATGSEIAINVADKNLFFKDSGGVVNTVPIRQSSTSSNGWLSSTDWNTFNNKAPAGAYLTAVTADSPLSGAGTSASHLVIAQANTSTSGYLSNTDWNTFNNKAPAFTYTAGYVPFGQGTTTPTQSANLQFSGTTGAVALGVGGSLGAWASWNAIQLSTTASISGIGGYANVANNWIQLSSGPKYLTTAAATIYIQNAGTHWWAVAAPGTAGDALTFTQAMTLHNSGGLSLGNTTDPGAGNLSVSGNTFLLGTTSLGGAGISFTTPDNAGVLSKFSAAGTGFQYRFGNVTNGYVGSITTTTVATAYNVTSDKRLKTLTNVATDTSVIDNTVVNDFTWLNGVVDRGVFAQDAYKVKPSAVHVGSDELDDQGNLENPWSVDYSKYVPDLIVKCQQQDKIINELLTRLIALETK